MKGSGVLIVLQDKKTENNRMLVFGIDEFIYVWFVGSCIGKDVVKWYAT